MGAWKREKALLEVYQRAKMKEWQKEKLNHRQTQKKRQEIKEGGHRNGRGKALCAAVESVAR